MYTCDKLKMIFRLFHHNENFIIGDEVLLLPVLLLLHYSKK